MEAATLLDARHLAVWERNDKVLIEFNRLPAGESLTVIHHQDLQSLFYRLLAERSGEFAWENQECGPALWQASITRRPFVSLTVGEVIREKPQARLLLETAQVDIVEVVDEPFDKVCREQRLSEDEVQAQLNASAPMEKNQVRAEDWPLSLLLDYIIYNHHGYIYRIAPQIKKLLARLTLTEGSQSTDFFIMKKYFELMTEELFIHLQKEEYIFFPIIRALIRAGEKEILPRVSLRLGDPAVAMEEEDQAISVFMANIRRVTDNYTLPAKASDAEWLLLTLLREFEVDLDQHMYLESKVLFNKALALEKKLTVRSAV